MTTGQFEVFQVAQLIVSLLGIYFGYRIVSRYLLDLRHASLEDVDRPRRFAAWSNVKREILVFLCQAMLLSVGVSYYLFPSPASLEPVIMFRQTMLLFITMALTAKSFMLLRDRRYLEALLNN